LQHLCRVVINNLLFSLDFIQSVSLGNRYRQLKGGAGGSARELRKIISPICENNFSHP